LGLSTAAGDSAERAALALRAAAIEIEIGQECAAEAVVAAALPDDADLRHYQVSGESRLFFGKKQRSVYMGPNPISCAPPPARPAPVARCQWRSLIIAATHQRKNL